jgi:hypothetical protein
VAVPFAISAAALASVVPLAALFETALLPATC